MTERSLNEEQRARLLKRLSGVQTTSSAASTIALDPEGRYSPFALTELQQAYFVGRNPDFPMGGIEPAVYQEFRTLSHTAEAIAAAWTVLHERHDMLRAVVLPEARQVVQPGLPVPLTIEDLRGQDEISCAASASQVRTRLLSRAFPAGAGPLYEVVLQVTDDETSAGGACVRIFVVVSTLICDGQSLTLLLAELDRRLAGDPPGEIPALRYRDVIVHSQTQADAGRREQDRRWWLAHLDKLPEPPGLPLVPEVERQSSLFVRRRAVLTAPIWKRIQARARERNLSVSTPILAAYVEVLGRWSQRARFLLNVTTFQRSPPAEEIIGDFCSLVLLAVDARRERSFAGLADKLQEDILEAMAHDAFSGLAVLGERARLEGVAQAGPAPVVFTSLLGTRSRTGIRGWHEEFGLSKTPQVWLDNQVLEQDGHLVMQWDAREEIFLPGVLDEMFRAFVDLVERLAGDEASWTAEPDVLAAPQRARRRVVRPDHAPERTLVDLLRAGRRICPQAPAAIDPAHTLDHEALVARAEMAAAGLRAHGVRPGDRVGIALPRGVDQLVAVAGVALAGAAWVPLGPGLPPERARRIEERTGVAHVIRSSEDLARACGGDPELRSAALVDPQLLAYLIFTSGSTGEPKGVMIDHRSVTNTILDINARFGIGPGDRILTLSSLGFDLSVYDFFGPLAVGGAVVFPAAEPRLDPEAWWDQMARARVTVWNSVPAMMELLLAAVVDHAEPPPLRLVLLSGDRIPPGLPPRIRSRFPGADVVSLGGATEASIWSIVHRIEPEADSSAPVPYGQALLHQTVEVLDERLRPCPDLVVGEIYIGGAGLALGYWGDPAQTATHFVPDPAGGGRLYRTGDRGRYRPDGLIEILGRDDDQVKVAGHRIELGEVEAAMRQHPLVRDALAAVTEDPRLVAVYVADGRLDAASLTEFLATLLPAYMIPSTMFGVEHLPVSGHGKRDRRAVAERGRMGGRARLAPPAAAHREAIASTWAELIGRPPASDRENFFSVGGSSILAMHFCARVREVAGVAVALRDFLSAPTLETVFRAERAEPSGPRMAPDVAPGEPFPLTELQEAFFVGRRSGFELGGVAPHLYVELDLGPIDPDRVETAWQRLVARHDMLRAVFTPDGLQRVLVEPPPWEVPRHDLRDLEETRLQERLEALRGKLSHRVADPERWPIVEVHVSLLPEGRTLMHVSFDLLVGDAWSIVVLSRELVALLETPDVSLPPLRSSFRAWTLARAGLRMAADRDRAWWLARLPSLPGPPMLPILPRTGPPRFQRREHALTASQWQGLLAACAAAGLPPSSLLCAAFAEVIGGWSSASRFLVNVAVFDRGDDRDMLQVVGDFTSILPLDVETGRPEPFFECARTVQERLGELLDHRAAGGVWQMRELARLLGLSRAGTPAPVVFTSTLGFEAPGGAPQAGAPLRVTYGISQTPQVWLDHQVLEREGTLVLRWDAVEALFQPGVLDAMFAAYIRFVEGLSAGMSNWEQARAFLRAPRASTLSALAAVPLPLDEEAVLRAATSRRSVRSFTGHSLTVAALGDLFAALTPVTSVERPSPKYPYASAGDLYCVEAWLVLPDASVEGLPRGVYSFHPLRRVLEPRGDAALAGIAAPPAGRWTGVRFAVLLIARFGPVQRTYGELALPFCWIEAGAMCQRLEEAAAPAGLGLCQVESSIFEPVVSALALADDARLLHALVGGTIRARSDANAGPVWTAPAPPSPELVARIAGAIAETLGLPSVAEDDDFFVLGGTSLGLVKLQSRLREALRRDVGLATLFAAPSASGIARRLSPAQPVSPEASTGRQRAESRRRALRGDR